jgi:hypothetical protein
MEGYPASLIQFDPVRRFPYESFNSVAHPGNDQFERVSRTISADDRIKLVRLAVADKK